MEFTYRGATYTAATPTADVYETAKEGLFLGARFKLKQPYANRIHRHSYQAPITLTYRGVSYTR